jgi:hypothetical protein
MGEAKRRGNMKTEQINLKIPLSSLNKRKCKCGGESFVPAIHLYEVSAIVSPNGKAGVIFGEAGFRCLDCGEPADMKPKEDTPVQGPVAPEKSNLIILGDKGGTKQ